jgi:hypothetical protein
VKTRIATDLGFAKRVVVHLQSVQSLTEPRGFMETHRPLGFALAGKIGRGELLSLAEARQVQHLAGCYTRQAYEAGIV